MLIKYMQESMVYILRLNRIGPRTDKVWKENLLFLVNSCYEMSGFLIFLRGRIIVFLMSWISYFGFIVDTGEPFV